MSHSIIRRIFGNRKLPENLSAKEYDEFMSKNFKQWVTDFEQGGFLEQTKLAPIRSEDELLEKLQEHKNDLMVIKYWKHGCVPCLSFAEMYKEAEEKFASLGALGAKKKKVVFYSVDTKAVDTKELVLYQMLEGTPTIQTFTGGKQVGDEIRAVNLEAFMEVVTARATF